MGFIRGSGSGSGGNIDSSNINPEQIPYTTAADTNIANVKNALDTLFYINPSINSFSVTPNTLEKGTVVNSITLNWATNKSIVSQSINQGIGTLANNLRTHTINGLNITNNTTYSLTINDGKNNASRNTSISFSNKRYWGVSNLPTLTNGDILALPGNELSNTRNQSKTFNTTSQYIYFAFPSSFGSPSFKVAGLDNDAWVKTSILFTNSKGFSENYDIYRSEFLQNGLGITVDIT